jgi:hypothetical protein
MKKIAQALLLSAVAVITFLAATESSVPDRPAPWTCRQYQSTICACNKERVVISMGNGDGINNTYTTSFAGQLTLECVDETETDGGLQAWALVPTAFSGTAVEPTLGTITVALDQTRASNLSTMTALSADAAFPRSHEVFAYTTITMSSTPGIVYRSLQQFHMRNNAIPSFGVADAHITYDVLNDVDFEDPANPGVVVFTVHATPVVINA